MTDIQKLKILCVEDEEFARDEMKYFLSKRGSEVHEAADGEEGLRRYRECKPDVIIADLLMPGMDGMEMIRRIRESDNNTHIVIVTSVNSVDTVIQAVDLGIDSYIVKPLDFNELELKLEKISNLIQADLGIANGPLDVLKNRRMIEDGIKKGTLKIVKDYMGKGPRETIVQLSGKQIRITILGGLTVMEENLIKDRKNHEMVRHQRSVAYQGMSKDMERLIGTQLSRNVDYLNAQVNLRKNLDQILFEIAEE